MKIESQNVENFFFFWIFKWILWVYKGWWSFVLQISNVSNSLTYWRWKLVHVRLLHNSFLKFDWFMYIEESYKIDFTSFAPGTEPPATRSWSPINTHAPIVNVSRKQYATRANHLRRRWVSFNQINSLLQVLYMSKFVCVFICTSRCHRICKHRYEAK